MIEKYISGDECGIRTDVYVISNDNNEGILVDTTYKFDSLYKDITNKYTINEIQSKSGYILFTALGKKYLASVVNVNTNQAMLKITPTDNNYNFQPVILSNLFSYISKNIKTKPKIILIN